MLPDLELQEDISDAYWWLTQMIAQLYGERPWIIDMGPDPMSPVRFVDALRGPLERQGMTVPDIVSPETDPLGNMVAWRDYLATLVTVH